MAQAAVPGQQRSEQRGPAAQFTEHGFADDEAEVCDFALDERYASISAGEEIEFHRVLESRGLGGCETPVELEADEIGLDAGRARPASKVVFAGGEKYAGGCDGFAG